MLSTHYRTKLTFSIEQCLEARTTIQRITGLYNRLVNIANRDSSKIKIPCEFQDFVLALDNDLDTPKALAIFFTWLRSMNKKLDLDNNKKINEEDINGAIKFLNNVDSIFGFLIKENPIPKKIHSLVADREKFRKTGDWSSADRVRDEIYSLGWIVEDASKGPIIKPKK